MHAKPFSKRTFWKEANILACKAAKGKALDVYAVAIKPKQGKAKKKTTKGSSANCVADNSDSDNSELVESMNNIEKPIPCKNGSKKEVYFCLLGRFS